MKSYQIIINKLSASFILIFLFIINLAAQPSGGPYGPLQQIYEIPKVDGKIFYVAPDGKTENSGEALSQPTAVESAIEKVKTGDAIIMRGGTYRTGNLILNQGITIQPYKDEKVIIKGTYVASDWKEVRDGIWSAKWEHLFPSKPQDWWQRNREGMYTPQHRFNNDMVFINGKFLQSAGWEGELDENSYYIDYDTKTVYVRDNPKNKLVEITAFDVALLRTTKDVHGKSSDKIGPTIKGITFTQYAYRALEVEGTEPDGISTESEHGKEVIGTTLENCDITFCSRVAAYLRGDKLTIRHCRISDTSTEGIYIIASSDVLLEQNIFMRNNIERITGYYPSAVKIFNQTHRVTCRDNLVMDLPYSNGIWYDVGNEDGVFINNWIQDVGNIHEEININQLWPSQNGFFFEISKRAVCAGNVFVNCDHGVWALNSSNVQFYNNTFVNSMAVIGRNARVPAGDHFGWHSGSGPDLDKREGHIFVNNLLYADDNFKRPLLFVWQAEAVCGKLLNSQLKEIDYNTYIKTSADTSVPLIYWSPVEGKNCIVKLNSPGEITKLHPGFSAHSKYLPDYTGQVFKSHELEIYQLLPEFSKTLAAGKIPAEIQKLTGQKNNYVGAFPGR